MKKHQESPNIETIKFVHLSTYVFRAYNLPSIKVRSAKDSLDTTTSSLVKSDILSEKIWALRGGIWFLLSLIAIIPIIRFSLNTNIHFILFVIFICLVSGSVTWAATSSWIGILETQAFLVVFHWLDGIVLGQKRSQLTHETSKYQLSLNLQKLMRTVQEAREKEEDDESPSYQTVGVLEETPQSRWSRHKYSEIIREECDLLRSLLLQGRWESFKLRFSDLRSSIMKRGEREMNFLIPNLMHRWSDCWKHGYPTHGFSGLRQLAHYMLDNRMISNEEQKSVRCLLHYDENAMADPSWAKAFMEHVYGSGDYKYSSMLRGLLIEYFENRKGEIYSQYYYDTHPRSASSFLRIKEEDEKLAQYGGPVFGDVSKKEIIDTPEMQYD